MFDRQTRIKYRIVSRKPIIIHTTNLNTICLLRFSKKVKDEDYSHKTVYFLNHITGPVERKRKLFVLLVRHSFFVVYNLLRYRNHKIVHLCNNEKQRNILRKLRISALYLNHNVFVDRHTFTVSPGLEKKYDAVYTSRFERVKRMELARKVDNLALISSSFGSKKYFDAQYFEEIRTTLGHAHLLNFDWNRDLNFLSHAEVSKKLNQCRTGLCLSAHEGAMLASIEYLLCGIPVVSTASTGGRDVFFDPRFTLIVNDTPNAVRDGVREIISWNLDPEFIRSETLVAVDSHWRKYEKLIPVLLKRENSDSSGLIEEKTFTGIPFDSFPAAMLTSMKAAGNRRSGLVPG